MELKHIKLYMKKIKEGILKIFQSLGYRLSRIEHAPITEQSNPYQDMQKLTGNNVNAVVFDIGANHGQSIEQFLSYFQEANIYAFEPSENVFKALSNSLIGKKNKVKLYNFGLGSVLEKKLLNESEYSVMSSFLEVGSTGWGKILHTTMVDIKTVDQFCWENNIHKIDILKSDTQGYDFEVLKGGINMLKKNVHIVYCELNFADMYINQGSFADICKLLVDNNFKLVKIYEVHIRNERWAWGDALFINLDFME